MNSQTLSFNKSTNKFSVKVNVIKKAIIREIKKNYLLYLLLILPVAYFTIFKYIPMYGIILAFRRYIPGKSIFGEQWVGFIYFEKFLVDPEFWNVFKNTILLSFFNLLFSFPIPIIFALLLNEIKNVYAKKIVQTVSYLPKFLSTVIVVSMIKSLLSPSTGFVNQVLEYFGREPINFLVKEVWFRPIYIISDIWQFMGWNSILYLAALSGIDPQLYEAAIIDGANRWKQTIHVTLPGIMPTIVIIFILSIGHILTVGFEKVLLLYSPSIYDTADVIQTYVYRMGLLGNNFSYATAVGLFQGVISLILLWSANKLSKKYSEYGLW